MVLAACHSLVVIDGGAGGGSSGGPGAGTLVGDPIEVASLSGVEWTWHGDTSEATPGAFTGLERALALVRAKADETERALKSLGAAAVSSGQAVASPQTQVE